MENSKLKPILLILGILIVLFGGGFALWSVFKKDEKDETKEQSSATTTQPPVTGRTNASQYYTAAQLAHSALSGSGKTSNIKDPDEPAPPKPKVIAVWSESEEGKRLIVERMKVIQMNITDSDFVRAKWKIGSSLVNNSGFANKAVKAVQDLFGQITGVDKNDYLTYPIYGKYEKDGLTLRQDLESFLSKEWSGYNLTELRHGGDTHWLESVALNLIYGNQNSFVHSADQIWWYKADRDGLDFYKALNGHDVEDRLLLKKENGKGVYAAGGANLLARLWLNEMNEFDRVTRVEAVEALVSEGVITKTKPKDPKA